MAREHEVVVFPTPPFPPTKIHRSDFWSRIDCSVGSIWSSSVLTTAVDMVEFTLFGSGRTIQYIYICVRVCVLFVYFVYACGVVGMRRDIRSTVSQLTSCR